MKPIENKTGKTLDIQEGDEVIGMTIDQDAMPFVMNVLTNLYSDVVLAVVREYSTNAWDAHIQAGDEFTPIEVSLPSNTDEFFRVRDYGVGLDVDDIRNIYSKYGNSTKRESNDVVGMLGMGCKSALAYCDEFYVTSVKNGVKVQVNVAKDENGVGVMNVVSQVRTNEKSGTEVAVPVEDHFDHNKFAVAAGEFYSYWPESSVKVNGENPARVDGLWLDSKTLLRKGAHNVVVMGNVPYRTSTSTYATRAGYVRFVEIGEVEFTPAREGLKETPYTQDALREIEKDVHVLKQAKFRDMISKAKSGPEAIEKWIEAKTYGFEGQPMWNGERIPETFNLVKDDEDNADTHMTLTKDKEHRKRRWSKEQVSVTTTWLARAGIMVGFTGKTLSPLQIEKFDLWKQQSGAENQNFILIPEMLPETAKWVDPKNVYQWDNVKGIKIPREKTQSAPVTLSGWNQDGSLYDVSSDDLPTKNLFYLTKGQDKEGVRPNSSLLDYYYDEWTVVKIGGNQVAKFEREFPTIKPVKKHEDELRLNWRNSLTKEDVLYLKTQEHNIDIYKKLDADQVNDPKLKSAIKAATEKRPDLDKARSVHGSRYGAITLPHEDVKFEDVLTDNYPMAALTIGRTYGSMSPQTKQHLYIYINAVYAEAKGEQ